VRRPRAVSILLAFVLAVTVLVVGPASAAPGRPAATPPSRTAAVNTSTATPTTDATQRPDQVSAQLLARQSGHRVEITGLRTQDTTTWANPDGTLTTQLATGPVRVKTSQGWQDIDTTLVADISAVHPKVAVGGARFSAGGDRALLQATLPGGRRLGLDWPGVLPAPTLQGDTATYPNVVAGGDLVVQALPGGFELSLVLRQRPTGGVLAPVKLQLTGDATLQAAVDQAGGGGLRVRDGGGKLLASGPPPVMFGAARDASGEPARQARLAMSVETPTAARLAAGGKPALVLAPDAGFLADPTVTYPVTIDPTISWLPDSDTYIQASNPTTNFNTAQSLLTGTSNSGTDKARSMLTFNTSSLLGKHILSATMHVFNFQSSTCTSTSSNPLQVHQITGGWNPATVTWNSGAPSWSNTVAASSNRSYQGTTGCPGAYIDLALTSVVASWAGGAGNWGVMLRAFSEVDNAGWRKFYSKDHAGARPSLDVTYNSIPGVTGRTPADHGYVTTLTPQLTGFPFDADGGTAHVDYQVWNATHTTMLASGSGPVVPVNSNSPWTIPAGVLADGGTYTWRARANDSIDAQPWPSGFLTFTADLTAPGAPSVTSSTHPDQTAWYAATAFSASWPAVPDAGGLAGYGVVLDDQPDTVPSTVTQTGTTYSATLPEGIDYLHVRAGDKAGNWGPTTHYKINVKGAITSFDEGARTQKYLTLRAAGDPAVTGATFQFRHADADPWTDIPLAAGIVVDTSTSTDVTAWPVPMTAGTTHLLRWNLPTTTGIAAADGPVQVRAIFTGGPGGNTQTKHATLDQKAFGSDYASEAVGPGSVNLITGNYQVADTDVQVASYGSDLTVSRTFNSRDPNDSANGPLGPGWVASLPIDEANADFVSLHDAGSYVIVTGGDGTQLTFARPASGLVYIPQADVTDLTLTAITGGFTLADTAANLTTFTKPTGATDYVPTKIEQPASDTDTTYTYEVVGGVTRVTRALAPVPTGVSCATLVAGCRALTVTYATATTATGTDEATWGDFAGRLKTISFTAYDPATSAMSTVTVSSYLYDSDGRLRAQWDPRISPALKTRYAYDTGGHLATITPPGELAWTLSYATITGDPNTGRLRSVSRPALPTGTATTTVAYQVPLSGSGAPYAMGPTDVASWAQTDLPTDATAIFPPDQVPADPPASYTRATVHYINRDGREVNQADPGGYVSSTEYDTAGNGNVVRELSAANRAAALATGSAVQEHADRARQLDTQNIYSADGLDLLETYGPMHQVQLASGDVVQARAHTVNTYDQGAPTGGPFHLVTTSASGARVDGTTADVDVRTTTTGYDGQSNLGWTLRQPTSVTVDPGATPHLALKTVTLYDPTTSLKTETRMPANPSGGDAHATKAIYYTAGTNSADSSCGNKPQWANLPCKSLPVAQPGTAGLPDLPVEQFAFNLYNQSTTITETVGTSTRTTSTTYDAAGRATDRAVTSSVGAAFPTTHTDYDASTGKTGTTSTTDASGTVTVIRGYDPLGRVTSYQDADGNTATTSYDLLDRPATVGDGKGTQTLTYDTAIDPRGLATSVADSAAGTFTARYDPDGNLVTQGYPNGMEARTTIDPTGTPTDLAYVKTSNCTSNCTWLAFHTSESIHGQILDQGSGLSTQDFTYDAVGRLASTQDTPIGGGCTIRTYGYDADSNRLSLNTKAPAADGACDTAATGTTTSHTYDAADRISDTGFTYDSFGRITTVPSAVTGTVITASYYANDMVRTLSSSGTTRTWTLDPTLGRARTVADSGSGPVRTYHYASDGDNPAWTAEDTTGTHWIRYITGPSEQIVATADSATGTTLQLENLHGDVVATASPSSAATGLLSTTESTEFGVQRNSPASSYGWLGGFQRERDSLTGILLMGVRLYSPELGRFLQVDPDEQGSANRYDYSTQDPVNYSDTAGTRVIYHRWHWGEKWHFYTGKPFFVACGWVACPAKVQGRHIGYKQHRYRHYDVLVGRTWFGFYKWHRYYQVQTWWWTIFQMRVQIGGWGPIPDWYSRWYTNSQWGYVISSWRDYEYTWYSVRSDGAW
jgi:RHS repeat-associated protein